MGNEWPETPRPRWRTEGRTGQNGPKYANRRDRAAVRGGGSPSNPPPSQGCCPMVAAVRSVKQGKFRLARRYAAMSARIIAARAVA